MAECKECLYYEVCADFRRNICETDQKRFEEYKINSNGICDNFKNKENFVEICRCKDCLYFEYKVGSYGICEHWHTNSQDIFDLNFCGYAEPRTPKERGGEK